MQVIYHIGAHCTDEDRLLKSLLKNRDTLQQHGVIVPGPGKYRKLIRQTLKSLDGVPPAAGAEASLLKAITGSEQIERLILSAEDFLTFASWVFVNQNLYGNAMSRIPALADLFPSAQIEFHLALRNPASFIPAVFARTKDITFEQFMRGVSPHDMQWSSLIHIIRASAPDAKLTVWCNEDTPMIWPRLMREVTGHTPASPFEGEADLLAEIMTADGLQRYGSYLETHPPQNASQHARIITAFLDKFAVDDALEDELDAPGWTQQLVDDLTHQYEEDLDQIGHIAGVNFITP
ncbi:hypothetical protein [Profundibacter sp.]